MKGKEEASVSKEVVHGTVMMVLIGISFSHLLNDTIQSLIPSIYPMVQKSFDLNFSQIGMITLTFQMTSSVIQPFVGYYTDIKPKPFSLSIGMSFTLIGLILLSQSVTYSMVLCSVGLVGVGSAIFHPEASRLAYLASGGKRGFAQSLFQVGGNAGSAIGPLLAAAIIVPHGQSSILWFSVIAILAIFVLYQLGKWYKTKGLERIHKRGSVLENTLPKSTVIVSLAILILLVFSKNFYMASMTSYFTFYMMDKFDVSVQTAQMYLFIFLASVAAGTFIGGPVGDRIGRKYVIWVSILGVAPFTILLPYANLFWTGILASCIGLILASAFSAILVYAQELMPGKVGMISGLFFGLAFAMGGIGSALLGRLADATSIEYVFHLCSFLPLLGLITAFLPRLEKLRQLK